MKKEVYIQIKGVQKNELENINEVDLINNPEHLDALCDEIKKILNPSTEIKEEQDEPIERFSILNSEENKNLLNQIETLDLDFENHQLVCSASEELEQKYRKYEKN